ncbi:MAG: hypothetical protein HBSAPP01_10800 [Candidatus Brocadia sapporoensis]|nr:MAG: hypothetical protein HBSAPP01_10800 [Candidatus Brocadia sapporoensis]
MSFNEKLLQILSHSLFVTLSEAKNLVFAGSQTPFHAKQEFCIKLRSKTKFRNKQDV